MSDSERPAAEAPSDPAPRHRRRRSWVVRSLVILASLLTLVLVGLLVFWYKLQSNITALPDLPSSTLRGTTAPGSNAPLNILLIGSDSRANGVLVGDPTKGARSDTTLLVHLNAARTSAIVASIPRDSMVEFPPCTSMNPSSSIKAIPTKSLSTGGNGVASATSGWRRQMFNEAFNNGGASCTVQVVEQNSKVPIDHVAVIDFAGFESMVNALGGVSVCVPKALHDAKSGLDLSAGTHKLNGSQALSFVRTRHAVGDGSDLARIKLQQAFLGAVVRQATSSELLTRPDRLYRFLDAATQSLSTDPGLASLDALGSLAREVQNIPPANIHFVTVPTEAYPADPNRVQWSDSADALWQAMIDDTALNGSKTPVPTSTTTTDPTTLVSPDTVQVQVINRTGVSGYGRQVGRALTAQGFTVIAPASASTNAAVVVRYPEAMFKQAQTVAAALPGAQLKVDYTLKGKTVIAEVGSSAKPVVAVPGAATTVLPSQTLAPTPKSSTTSSPSISANSAAQDTLCG